MTDELNTPDHRWYQKRYNIPLAKEDFSKQWIYASGISKIDAWIDLLTGGAGGEIEGSWDISTSSFVQSFSIAAQDGNPTGIFFKPDGTKMYITGDANNLVYEYDLSTAWDISTASYLQSGTPGNFTPAGLWFKPDGTKMYTMQYVGDRVYERDLSTAWDVSTAAAGQSFSVTDYEAFPTGVSFKPDGTKMYVTGYGDDEVNEFDLSTGWDVSTASHVQAFSVATQDTTPYGIYFKPDGTKMYIAGDSSNNILEYDVSTAWDISTASYLQSFSIASKENTIRDVYFKPDGTGFYIIGWSTDTVHQYSIV